MSKPRFKYRIRQLLLPSPRVRDSAVKLSILGMGALAVASAGGDRAIRVRYADNMTDDAYVRADITPLASRVEGYVLREHIHDYQRVEKGQLLFEIDPVDIEAAVQLADAKVHSGAAAIAVLRGQERVAREAVKVAQAAQQSVTAEFRRAELEAARQTRLLREGVGTQQNDEDATFGASRLSAEVSRRTAELARAESELAMLAAEIQQAQAELKAAEAALEVQKLQLGYTRIIAPAAGMVGERQVHVGHLVKPSTPCVTMVDIDHVWVTANFKENQIGAARPGDRAKVWVDTYPDRAIEGRIDELAPASGAQFSLLPPDNATGNFTKIVQRIPVKVLLEIPEDLRGLIRPGMSAVVELTKP